MSESPPLLRSRFPRFRRAPSPAAPEVNSGSFSILMTWGSPCVLSTGSIFRAGFLCALQRGSAPKKKLGMCQEARASVSDRTASPAARAMLRRIFHSFPTNFRAEVQGLALISRRACRLPVKDS